MAHKLACALQQPIRIRQRCALKKSHGYVRREYVDIAKSRISQARRWRAVMQKLPDFVPAFSHHLKPLLRDGSQFTCMLFPPRIDGRITLASALQSKQFGSPGHWIAEPSVLDIEFAQKSKATHLRCKSNVMIWGEDTAEPTPRSSVTNLQSLYRERLGRFQPLIPMCAAPLATFAGYSISMVRLSPGKRET